MDDRWAGNDGIDVDAPLCDRVCSVAFDAAIAALEATGALFPFGVVLDGRGEVAFKMPNGATGVEEVESLLDQSTELLVGATVDLVEVSTNVGRKDAIRIRLRRAGRPARVVYGFLESHEAGFGVGQRWTEDELSGVEDA